MPAPMGFSIQNGLRASNAASAENSRWRKFGEQIDTTSTSGWASTTR